LLIILAASIPTLLIVIFVIVYLRKKKSKARKDARKDKAKGYTEVTPPNVTLTLSETITEGSKSLDSAFTLVSESSDTIKETSFAVVEELQQEVKPDVKKKPKQSYMDVDVDDDSSPYAMGVGDDLGELVLSELRKSFHGNEYAIADLNDLMHKSVKKKAGAQMATMQRQKKKNLINGPDQFDGDGYFQADSVYAMAVAFTEDTPGNDYALASHIPGMTDYQTLVMEDDPTNNYALAFASDDDAALGGSRRLSTSSFHSRESNARPSYGEISGLKESADDEDLSSKEVLDDTYAILTVARRASIDEDWNNPKAGRRKPSFVFGTLYDNQGKDGELNDEEDPERKNLSSRKSISALYDNQNTFGSHNPSPSWSPMSSNSATAQYATLATMDLGRSSIAEIDADSYSFASDIVGRKSTPNADSYSFASDIVGRKSTPDADSYSFASDIVGRKSTPNADSYSLASEILGRRSTDFEESDAVKFHGQDAAKSEVRNSNSLKNKFLISTANYEDHEESDVVNFVSAKKVVKANYEDHEESDVVNFVSAKKVVKETNQSAILADE